MFNVRVVSVDHYIGKPIDELYVKEEQNLVKEWQEPVLRIFGATAEGLKSCVHVHGVYPYIYAPYRGGENAERDALLLGAALDEALRTSFKLKIFRFVHKVTVISGIPLYGYHSKPRQFFKIYFFNPFHVRKAFDLLLSGAILGQKFQPHEAHIPYALQFMMDYNIYGMSFVAFSKVKYRRDPENPDSLNGVNHEDILSDKVKKMTWSQVEVDAWASDILNRAGQKSVGVNPGLDAIWEEEQSRRRAQNRNSQITLRQSQSRPDVPLCPTEVMYKARLAQRLADVSIQETVGEASPEEPALSYPAEVPEEGDFLEASALDEDLARPRAGETVGDASGLVDERILTQISGSRREKAQSESEDEMEFDSVLGRNQKSEEEAELEDEEGVDMTQPLDSDDEVICGAEGNRRESGSTEGDGEETFWRNMADKIFQLDGAQESSSESEAETGPSGSSPAFPDGALEFSSSWSGNIMSILSECPTPSASCPTPRTLWFDYSPDLVAQDSWISNKSVAPFSDFAEKNPTECPSSSGFPEGLKEMTSGEPYDDFFSSTDGDYFPTSLLCDAESTTSPPSAALPPTIDGPEVNLDTICGNFQSPTKEKAKLSSPDGKLAESKVIIKGKSDNDQQKFLQVLRSFSGRPSEDASRQLTLKQYIKDCKEIVSVDFKNLCNREMIIIEYKSQSKRSLRNKYLIKPLDKFLESWNSAERKASDRTTPKDGTEVTKEFDMEEEKNVRSNYVINVVGKRFSDVQSMRNKLTVKSMEISPDEGSCKDRCYNVNENVISRGEIKMKLIKSQHENKNLVEGALKHQSDEKRGDVKRMKGRNGEAVKMPKEKLESRSENVRNKKKAEKWKNFLEPDTKLINEINSSFEEYFKSIVKSKHFYRKRKKSIVEKKNYDEEEEDDEEEEEEAEEEEKEETSEDENPNGLPAETRDVRASSNADSIKFVSRFLSTFSQMSDVPPMSITIRLGNPNTSAPIKVNLRPSAVLSGKEARYRSKKHRRKMKIENVDGPVDGSSSEESAGGDSKGRPRGRKKKREGYYKPLNVVVCPSPREAEGSGKKRRRLGVESEATPERRRNKKLPSDPALRDRFGVCRERPRPREPREGKQGKVSSRSLMECRKTRPELTESPQGSSRDSGKVFTESSQEADFIGDSDEERKLEKSKSKRGSAKWLKKITIPKRIPQADTEPFASSDDDRTNRDPEKIITEDPAVAVGKKTELALMAESSGNVADVGERRREDEELKVSSSPEVSVGPSASWDFRESVTQKWDSEAFFAADVAAQATFSPFPLSGSPLFASKKNSPESVSSATGSLTASFPFTEVKDDSLSFVSGCKTFRPKKHPADRKRVIESMQLYGILESEDSGPFYGNPLDATKASETGFKGLKIENRSAGRLKPFKSALDVTGTEERRNALLRGQKTPRWQLVGRGDTTITPLAKPPSREIVSSSLLTKTHSENTKESEKAKRRMMKPLSPGQEMGSEDEEIDFSVTMSNFSPEDGNRESGDAGALSQRFPPTTEASKSNKAREESEKCSSEVDRKGIAESAEGDHTKDAFLRLSEEDKGSSKDHSFRIRGVTLENTFGFSHSVEDLEKAKLRDTHQYMSLLAMELHVETRRDLRPDPDHDPIRALFYAMNFDSPSGEREAGILVVGERFLQGTGVPEASVHYVETEKALVEKFLFLVRRWDPEILAGYEIEMHSWGYLVQRGFVLGMNLPLLLGRVKAEDYALKKSSDSEKPTEDDEDIPRSVRHMRISGRIILDVWRVLRHEIALTSYTFENVMYHLSQERHPLLSWERLTYFWEHQRFRHLVVEHFSTRVLGLVKILDRLDFVNRTSELSRLFGIQFYEVLSRGSQFRVESMMLRLAKPLNYVPTSPSISQRAAMRAPASLPLILEPESLFYTDPVIVLDFQSLYPSIIISNNYCFSTCLGRVEKLGGREPFEFGCTQLQISPEELKKLENDVTVSPAGVAFVKSNIRKGVLPTMLERILETRLMVKKSMKENKENKILQKVLHARQLGLKLIANVTYGYTAANFSGRMPCIEVGDSVVSKGRETLQRAIQLVKNTREWGARVVYGDTDSIFVLTPGRSKEEAFKIGAEIAEAVTRDNPKPVKLKLEKVYQPSILQTKKRYVGYCYESPDQAKPEFEAKGIETVRRDGCPATGKILEKALRILFETKDVSLVKKYTLRQFSKLYRGRVNLQDLIFSKEYRGRRGYRPGACVPALSLARRWSEYDKRAEPRAKERVPYVVVNGPPGVPLIRLVRSPTDLISDPSLRINATYYITKAIIPPMQRCFSLLGADVASWYAEMPRKRDRSYKWNCDEGRKRNTISQYFAASECVVCSEVTNAPVCQKCEAQPQVLAVVSKDKIRRWERSRHGLEEICRSCCGRPTELDCVSLDCPVLFRRKQAERAEEQGEALRELLTRYL